MLFPLDSPPEFTPGHERGRGMTKCRILNRNGYNTKTTKDTKFHEVFLLQTTASCFFISFLSFVVKTIYRFLQCPVLKQYYYIYFAAAPESVSIIF